MIGFHLSSEEHDPRKLARLARLAEEAGFGFAPISDHFHPWVNRQGHSPFVWGVLGAISETTERIEVGTAVTCPLIRTHPAVIAHAAATAAAQLEGRFFLGVGTGERLNEHVLGDHWPPVSVRQEMLEEAMEVIRRLWSGDMVTFHGTHYTVENARIFTLPEQLPPVVVAASGTETAEVAAGIGEGLYSTSPSAEIVEAYRSAGGTGPAYSMMHVCVAPSKEEALATVKEWWPNTAMPGATSTELSIPEHFEPLGDLVSDEHIRESTVLGADPDEHVEELEKYFDAGYDRVAVHQIGPDQEPMLELYGSEVLGRLEKVAVPA